MVWFGMAPYGNISMFLQRFWFHAGGMVSVMTHTQYQHSEMEPPQLQYLHRDHFGESFPGMSSVVVGVCSNGNGHSRLNSYPAESAL